MARSTPWAFNLMIKERQYHAVCLLASAPKDRTSSEHADWVATKVALGQALVEVPDYAHCAHTRAGQELGLMQW